MATTDCHVWSVQCPPPSAELPRLVDQRKSTIIRIITRSRTHVSVGIAQVCARVMARGSSKTSMRSVSLRVEMRNGNGPFATPCTKPKKTLFVFVIGVSTSESPQPLQAFIVTAQTFPHAAHFLTSLKSCEVSDAALTNSPKSPAYAGAGKPSSVGRSAGGNASAVAPARGASTPSMTIQPSAPAEVGGGTHASESAGAGAGDSPDIQEQRWRPPARRAPTTQPFLDHDDIDSLAAPPAAAAPRSWDVHAVVLALVLLCEHWFLLPRSLAQVRRGA